MQKVDPEQIKELYKKLYADSLRLKRIAIEFQKQLEEIAGCDLSSWELEDCERYYELIKEKYKDLIPMEMNFNYREGAD